MRACGRVAGAHGRGGSDYRFEVVRRKDPFDLDWYFALTLHPVGGMWVKVHKVAPPAGTAPV